MLFMHILVAVPFESLENLLYMKYSICLWERGMARRAEHLSSEKRRSHAFLWYMRVCFFGGPLKTVGFRLVLHIPLKERRTQMENHGTHSHMVC